MQGLVLIVNKRTKILTTVVCIGLFLIGVALFTKSKPHPQAESFAKNAENNEKNSQKTPLAEGVSTLSLPSSTQEISKEDPCLDLKKENSPYASLEKLKMKEKVNSRFENTHLRIEGKVFRLRRFYKDGAENEKEKYLVLEEDENEEAILKESSDHKPGALFQKLQKSNAEIIYKEEGVQTQSGLFLHYIDGKLQSLQGTIQNKNLDCVINP